MAGERSSVAIRGLSLGLISVRRGDKPEARATAHRRGTERKPMAARELTAAAK